jgi:hypothetical protein
MTRPRLTVAEVIRSCLDEFLERYGRGLTPEERRALKDLTSCRTAALGGHVLGCPACRQADRLQLLRQSPLPHLPGRGRGTVDRLHASQRPRPNCTGQSAGRLRLALTLSRRDLVGGGRRSQAPGCPDRRVGCVAHLGPEPPIPPARPLRRAWWRIISGRHKLDRVCQQLLSSSSCPAPGVSR